MKNALCALFVAVLARGLSAQAVNVQLYQRVEQAMTNPTSFANPFTDTELRLAVTAPAGRPLGSSFTWYGFHDGNGSGGQGGNVWKFRLLLDHPGTWTVAAGFYAPGTNTANGPSQNFTYAVGSTKAPGEHGHVYRDPQNWRRFRHADGTPWVPFVMHGSMLLDRDSALARQWIDEHAARGIDAVSARFHAEAWILSGQASRYHWLLSNGSRATAWPGTADAFDYNRFDVASWSHNEQAIEHAGSKGMKLSIWFGISGINRQYWSYGPKDYPNNTTLGPKQKLFIRYFLSRWAPYPNWWHWTVDSEYEETGSGSLDRIRTFAAEMNARNPWKTLVTTHVLSNWTPGNAPEFHLATLQRRVADTDAGATDCRSFVTDNDDFNLPVYNAEGVWELSNLTRSRVATWAHLFAGGFSHIAHFDTDGTHETSSWGTNWTRVNARHKEDAAEIGKSATFFNKTSGIDIGRCVPSHGLVSLTGGSLALCLAQAGESYYVWADRGGSSVRLDLSGASGSFSVARYRCSALTAPTTLASVSGGGIRDLGATPTTGFGNEYLFVVKRADGASLTVSSPNGGETWTAGGTATVTWSSSGSVANVRIELSADGGATYPTVLAANTPNDGSQAVSVPNVTTGQARVRVSDAANASVNDASNANFAIQSSGGTVSNVSATSGRAYEVDLLDLGKLQYVDRAFTFTAVPASYVGLEYIRTANDDKGSMGNTFLSFSLSAPATVYVAHDDRFAAKPSWMAGWADTGADLVSGGGTFSLFGKDYMPGTVMLGGNTDSGLAQNSMYTVVVRPAGGGGPVDTDGDGMTDAFEATHGFDPLDPDQDRSGTPDGQDDWDLDGTPNASDSSPGPVPGGGGPAPSSSGGGNGGCGATGLEVILLLALVGRAARRG